MRWGRIEHEGTRAALATAVDATHEASFVPTDVDPTSSAAHGPPLDAATMAADRSAARERIAASDAEIVASASSGLGRLATPQGLLMLLQSRLRDIQVGQREQDVRAASSRADVQRAALDRARDLASAADAARAESEQVGDIFRGIAAGLALVAGAASAVFTGGAGLVAAVGIAIAVLGPVVSHELARAHVIDGQAELITSVTCAVVGAALSFGAGAVAGGVSAAGAAGSAAIQAVQLASATASIAQGGAQVAAGVYEGEQLHASADAREADQHREAALDELDEAASAVRILTRRFGRVAARMQALGEVEAEGRRAASGWRA